MGAVCVWALWRLVAVVVLAVAVGVGVVGAGVGERWGWDRGVGGRGVREGGGGLVMGGVVLEVGQEVVGDGDGAVEAGVFFDGREGLIVFEERLGIEEAALVFDVEGAVKTGSDDVAIDMPFAGLVGAVAEGFESSGDESGPGGAGTRAAEAFGVHRGGGGWAKLVGGESDGGGAGGGG